MIDADFYQHSKEKYTVPASSAHICQFLLIFLLAEQLNH